MANLWDINDIQDYQYSENPAERAMYRDMVNQRNSALASTYGLTAAPTNPATVDPFARVAQIDDLIQQWSTNTNPDLPTMNITPEQRATLAQKIAANPTADYKQFLSPEQRPVAQMMETFAQQSAGQDGMAKALQAGMIGGFGALAGPSLFGGAEAAGGGGTAGADAAWGVNPASQGAASEFSLAGGTAGNAAGTGGLSSAAGGVTGLTAGTGLGGVSTGLGLGSGSAGLAAGAAGSSALLTPALAAAAGIPYAAGLTAAEAMGGVASSAGLGGAPAGTAPPPPGSNPIGRIFDGSATASDWASVLGSVGGSLLGVAGANAQGDAYSDTADKYLALGAPYRDKLAASYAPGFSMADQPDFKNALDIGAQAAARATSAKVGNPVDNPGAYADIERYVSGALALPQLNTYRSQLGTFGNLGVNTAGTNDTNAAGQTSGMYNALGYGLGQLTQPNDPYENLTKGLLSKLTLNNGFSF